MSGIDAREIACRVERMHSAMDAAGVAALFVGGAKNVEYLTGRDTGRALLSRDGDFLWTRELYRELYEGLYSGRVYPYSVYVYEKDAIKKQIKRMRLKRLTVENIPLASYEALGKDLGIKLAATDMVEKQRAVKSDVEIALLKKSAGLAMKGMRRAYEVVSSGVREIDALALIEYEIRSRGSDSPPFNDGMLLSSGKGSADIHAKAGTKRIGKNTTVVVDLGGRFCGYYSDMTRTLEVGRADALCRDLLEFVDGLRAEAIDRIYCGVAAGEVHGFIEREIEKKGYRFYHSGGHGVGLNVHELPTVGKDSEDILGENMVFTIEPGIYVPGKYGIRFEDMVLLRKGKTEVLTR